MALVDLHLHTTASDGRLSPTQLINLVAQRGLQAIAITDHDSTEGLDEAMATAAAFPQLTVIPGIELSTDVPGGEIHVLAYFIREKDPLLLESLRGFRRGRLDRGKRMVEKLNGLGLDLEWKRVQGFAGDGSVGRPHVALAMVEKGYVKNTQEAFDLYIGRNGPAYAEREKLTPEDAVRLINRWGGAAVLAHPGDIPDLDSTLESLKDAGIAGMEVYYARYSSEKVRELAEFARRHGLTPCGGSDYHGLDDRVEPLPGTLGPPLEVVERLEKLAREKV